jgi:hypothetical protein
MRFDRQTIRNFIHAQCRAWGSYFIWQKYAAQDLPTVTGFFEFIAFLLVTEIFYQTATGIFIKKEPQ